MKKLLLISLAAALSITTAQAQDSNTDKKNDYYLQYGVSFSNAQDTLVECRGSLLAVGGYNINDYLGIEARYNYGLGEHYQSYGAYIKPKYKDLNLLLGYGHTDYLDHDLKYDGGRVGIAYTLLDKITTEVIHRCDESDTTVSVLWNYEF